MAKREQTVKMAEANSSDRVALEGEVARAEIEADSQGRALAFVLIFICIAASIAFFAVRNYAGGGVLLGLPVVGMIRTVLPQRRSADE